MLNYCLNEAECRRALIAKSFGEKWQPTDCLQQCDICYRNEQTLIQKRNSIASYSSHASNSHAQELISCTMEEDITEHCSALVEIIEHAQSKDQRLTALKLIESWRGHGSVSNRAKHVPVTKFSETKCEKVVLRALLEGILKEEFHFTPYSTISYIGLGRSTIAVKRGILRITMKVSRTESSHTPKTVSKQKQPLNNKSKRNKVANRS